MVRYGSSIDSICSSVRRYNHSSCLSDSGPLYGLESVERAESHISKPNGRVVMSKLSTACRKNGKTGGKMYTMRELHSVHLRDSYKGKTISWSPLATTMIV